MLRILSLDPSRQYIGFEPQVACCFMIQGFLEKNHISDYEILPIGLSNKNGTVKLFLREGNYDLAASIVRTQAGRFLHFTPQCLRKERR